MFPDPTTIVAFIFVLGVMVFVHELGHYIAAKRFDVRVEAFSIGFGPRLFGFQHGETEWKVCVLPLGGFVKMAGESIGEPTGDPREFLSKPRWQRIIIAFAGPLANFILALFIPFAIYMIHYERPQFLEQAPVIGFVEAGSQAEKSGIQRGDTILSLGGDVVPTWQDLRLAEVAATNETVDVTFRRAGAEQTVPVLIDADENSVGHAGWTYESGVVLTIPAEAASRPAAKAGVETGDALTAIDGTPVYSAIQVAPAVQASNGAPVVLSLEREGKPLDITVTPYRDPTVNEWRVGVGITEDLAMTVTQLGPVAAMQQSYKENLGYTTLMFRFLKKLVQGQMSPKLLEGPVGIARASGDAARSGWRPLLGLMAIISLNLGIFNLLPIPILDGGQIAIFLTESILRRDLSIQLKERIIQVGFVFLMMLFAFVMYNDIMKSWS